MQFTKIHQKLAKPVYEAIPKIAGKAGKKWEWKLRWGDFCLYDKEIMIVIELSPDIKLSTQDSRMRTFVPVNPEKLIPLLYWEDHLEPTLEELGWDLWGMERTVPSSTGAGSLVVVTLAKGELLRCGRGKDRQEAFQRAVLAVAEKLEAREGA